jgi:hypothetical protein
MSLKGAFTTTRQELYSEKSPISSTYSQTEEVHVLEKIPGRDSVLPQHLNYIDQLLETGKYHCRRSTLDCELAVRTRILGRASKITSKH